MHNPNVHLPRQLAVAAAGMALTGAASGLREGIFPLVERSALVPAALAATVLLMLPTLYIGAAFAGVAPSATRMLGATATAVSRLGIVLAGLVPALGFLVLAGPQGLPRLVVTGCMLLAALVGLRALYAELFDESPYAKAIPLFGIWSAISLGIGAQLLTRTL